MRNIFLKLKSDYPKTNRAVLLRMISKAMSETLEPEGIVPSALMFCEFPSIRQFYVLLDIGQPLADRARIAHSARKLMESRRTGKNCAVH